MGFWVYGLGFRVWGVGKGFQHAYVYRFSVQCSVQVFGFRSTGLRASLFNSFGLEVSESRV